MTHFNHEDDELSRLDQQVAFTSAYIFALGLNIYAVYAYKDILINKNKSNFNQQKINKIALLSSSIALIVTIYFFIESYEEYENDKVPGLFDFYIASTLSMLAQSIRFNALIKHPDDIIGVQDIV